MGNIVVLNNTLWLNLAVALGIGLLVGAERERSKGMDPDRLLAGIRTFTIVALLGAVSAVVSFWLLIVSVICVTVFAALAYVVRVNEHPGLTTEITLVFTAILGGLAMTTSKDILEAMANGSGPKRVLVTLGYASWGEGQLESEIGENSWLTVEAEPSVIFDTPIEQRYEKALAILGLQPWMLSTVAGHA